jgi:hypothetical protein
VLLRAGETQTFTAFGDEGQSVIWSTSAGQLSGTGRTVSYIPPADGGTYTVTARLAADSSVVATATVPVVGTALTSSHLNLLPGESVPVTWLNAASLEPVWSATRGSISGSGESVTYTAPTTTGTYTISLDADGQYDPAAIPRVLSALQGGRADMVLIERDTRFFQRLSWSRRQAHRLGRRKQALTARHKVSAE